jgi:glyoxylase I family protein
MEAIDHLDLVVGSLERSLPFYEGLLRPLGYASTREIAGERGERVVYLSRHGGGGSIGLRERQEGEGAHNRYALGVHHVAFAVSTRAGVDRIAAWAAEHGGEIEDAPGERSYTPGYYAAFIRDPDGIKLEFLHRPSERDLALRVARLEERLRQLEEAG